MQQFLDFLTSGDLDLWPLQLKIGIPLTRAMGKIYSNFDFSTFFVLELRAGTEQTDGQMDRQDA